MADWFKFYNDALDSKGMQYALSQQPLVPSVWLLLLSEASKNRSFKFSWSDDEFEIVGFARKLNIQPDVLTACLGLLEKIKYIRRGDQTIEIIGWERMQSFYARGLDRGYYGKNKPDTNESLTSNSLDSTTRGEERRVEEKKVPPISPPRGTGEKTWKPTDLQKRLGAIFHRRADTPWGEKEIKALQKLGTINGDDLKLVEEHYRIKTDDKFLRKDLVTLLNNFSGEVDRARNYTPASNGAHGMNATQLSRVIEAKQKLATELKNRYCTETGVDTRWDNDAKRLEYVGLKREIKELTEKLAKMA